MAGVPAVMVAASTSLFAGGSAFVLYLIIQQLENTVIVPYVISRTAGINPIMTLIALSVGGRLGGLLGAILAVPVAVVIETAVAEFMKSRHNT
ncbi:MAG: hypothetical protein UZ22_OP11002000965 [Microgenomates bacterium OLB23]|nr:MAG: hypothetical protein UZ22_OP11002000965 [Microgenomates bacterium OLB23]